VNYRNIIESSEENKKLYEKNEIFPPAVIFETTNYCNLSCKFCGHSCMTRPKGYMSLDLYKKGIEEVATENPETEVWMIFYGEPLILKYKVVYLINYAKKKGLKNVYLNTNGLLLDKELSEALIESGLDRIVFSLDGYYEESYKKIRNNDNFEIVKKNIEDFLAVKKRLNSKIRTEIQLIEIPGLHREGEIELFSEYWSKFDVELKIKPYVTWTGAINIENVRKKDRYPCSWLFRTFVITWTGEVAQCGCDYDKKVTAGDINKQTIKEVWQGYLKKVRDLHLEERYNETEICENCLDWDSYILMPFLKDK
jgi:radical SAM protein with 4Fe4S-binding SPASM domain